MPIDFDAIRRKLNKLSGNTTSRKDSMWKPADDSETNVRLLSFPNNEGQPFKERWFYYGIGNSPGLLAPHQFGKPDPVQELINKLREDGTKESLELAKKLYPKMRCYAPVIVRGEEDKGVRLWAFSKTVYQSLLNIMLDEDYGDITDALEGRDIRVAISKVPGKSYSDTKVTPRAKTSKLSEDSKKFQEWTSNIPDLDELYSCKSYEELEKIVNDWLNGDQTGDETGTPRGASPVESDTSDPDTDDAPAQAAPSPKKAAPASGKYKNLDDAFADLEDL